MGKNDGCKPCWSDASRYRLLGENLFDHFLDILFARRLARGHQRKQVVEVFEAGTGAGV